MLDTNKRTLHFDKAQCGHSHPSLLPLRMALTAAERVSPARPQRIDVNAQRAMQLIERMKTDYQKPLPFTSWKDDPVLNSFRLQEVIGTNVG